MKKTIIALSAVGALLFAALLGSSEQARQVGRDGGGRTRVARDRYVPDRLIVKFKDDTRGVMAEAGRVRAEYDHNLKRVKHFDRIGVHVYQTDGPAERTIKALKKNPNVAYVEPDYIITLDAVPNDPYFADYLWGLNNTGQSGGTIDADIDAPEAWDLTTGNGNVVVAVIDTGVAYTHPDLAANMWTNPGETPGNGLDDDGNGYVDDVYGINAITGSGDPMDDHNHGSHCAGTIAAVGNNGVGVTGVCWTAKIMALKFITAQNSGAYSDAIECIEYAVAKGAHILSNSWGGYDDGQALKDAIDDAADAGLLFVAAAGNDGTDNDGAAKNYPASYLSPNIIAVAATNRNDTLSVFTSGGSNYGAYSVDVAAPGSSILSTDRTGAYVYMSGTSMATPHVAGLAALIKSYNFSLNWMQIKERILGGVDPLPALQGMVLTGGRINAYDSLLLSDPASYILNVSSLPSTGAPITLSPADLDGASSGTTPFTRRYTPYASVTLTAPATYLGMDFGYWALEGSRYSDGLSITLPVDFNHNLTATYVVPVAEAVDNTALELLVGGHAGGFYGQVTTSHQGGDAAQSHEIGDSESGYMQTSVHGPGDLSFYWKVSSQAGADILSWSLDGVEMNAISGEVDWQQVTYALGTGAHVIQWVYAKNAGGSAGADCGWLDDVQYTGAPATLAQALDAGLTAWLSGGNGGWFHQASDFQYDGDAARSSALIDGQETYLQTTVTGPAPLSFYWKVSSEEDWDFLVFTVDDEIWDAISGEVDWSLRSYDLAAGSHTLRWVYSKDASVSDGSDCGWVDHIVFNPSTSHTLSLTAGGTGLGKVRVGADPVPHALPYQEIFPADAEVTLLAVADSGSSFTGWSGDLVSTANPAAVTMNTDKGVTAAFEPLIVTSLTVTAPDGGETWVIGSTHSVTWTQTGLSGTVTVDLYKGGVLLKTLGTSDAAAGTFPWTIADSETPGNDYRIRVWQGAVLDESAADFSLVKIKADFDGDGREDLLWRYQGSGVFQGMNCVWLMNQTVGLAAVPSGTSPMEAMTAGLSIAAASAPARPAPMDAGYPKIASSIRSSRSAMRLLDLSALSGTISRKSPMGSGRPQAPRAKGGNMSALPNVSVMRGEAMVNAAADGLAGIAALLPTGFLYPQAVTDLGWEIAGAGDFDADGDADILWRNYGSDQFSGFNCIWYMNGVENSGYSYPDRVTDLDWKIVGTGDFDRNGYADILWRNMGTGQFTGFNCVWYMGPGGITGYSYPDRVTDLDWEIVGTGDFDRNGYTDILWRNKGTGTFTGFNCIWYMGAGGISGYGYPDRVTDLDWRIEGTGDFNRDGYTDIIWRYYGGGAIQGYNCVWYMENARMIGVDYPMSASDLNWKIVNR